MCDSCQVHDSIYPGGYSAWTRDHPNGEPFPEGIGTVVPDATAPVSVFADANLLVCFDVDGTLETSGGPVKIAQLEALRATGAYVAIVSPSSARPSGWPEFISGARRDNLEAAHAAFPSAVRLIYVSDNNDQAEAAAAGFEYVDARTPLAWLQVPSESSTPTPSSSPPSEPSSSPSTTI